MFLTLQQLHVALSEDLPSNQVRLHLNLSGTQLTLIINKSRHLPPSDYRPIADALVNKLQTLAVPGILTVKIFGRRSGEKYFDWQDQRILATPSPQPARRSRLAAAPSSESSKLVLAKSPSPQMPDSPRAVESGGSGVRWFIESCKLGGILTAATALTGIFVLMGLNMLASQKPGQWEYQLAAIEDSQFSLQIALMGKAGWELVSARPTQSVGDGQSNAGDGAVALNYDCIFKRPKPRAWLPGQVGE